MRERSKPSIAILASGNGTTAETFIHATQNDNIFAKVSLVICNNPPEKAGVYNRINELNNQYGLDIETLEISGRTHPEGNVGRGQTLSESSEICRQVSKRNIAHIACMGYLKMIRGELIEEYGWHPSHKSIYEARMTNTHPGILPETEDTYGINASAKVLSLGLKQTNHTVHLVGAGIDQGPILAEHPVKVLQDDTAQSLFDRVQVVEKKTLPHVLSEFLLKQQEYFLIASNDAADH